MPEHGFSLVVETAVFEGRDEIFDAFALDADVGGEDVVAYCKHAGNDDHRSPVEERG